MSSVEISSKANTASIIAVPGELESRIAAHKYLPDLPEARTVKALSELVDQQEGVVARFRACAERLKEAEQLVRTQSSALSTEKRRIELLRLLTAEPLWSNVERILKGAALDYQPSLPAKYSSDPTSPIPFVDLPDSRFDLRSVDPDVVAAEQARKDRDINTYQRVHLEAERTNLIRRLLAYYDPDVLVPFLEDATLHLTQTNAEAASITGQLRVLLDQSREERLAATVLVRNAGSLPLAVRQTGILRLIVPAGDGKGSATSDIRISAVDDPDGVLLVDGGKTQLIRMQSDQTVREIVNSAPAVLGAPNWSPGSDLQGSRLMLLYRGKDGALTGLVRLARADANPDRARIDESDRRILGFASRDIILSRLEH